MLNDRKDDYEGSDDSEYHFSDDEVSYEADAGPAKKTASSVSGAMETAGKSKKILISFGVFVALIFVVYKMVAPGSSAPTTDIAPQAAAPAPMQASSAQASAPSSAAAPVMPVTSQQAPANQSSALQQMAATQQVQQTQQSLQAQQAVQQDQLSAQQAMQNMQNMNPVQQSASAQPAQASTQAPAQAMPQMQQAGSQAQQAMSQMQQSMDQPQQSAPQQAQMQTANGMPAVMPIQSPPPTDQAAPMTTPVSAMPPQMQAVDAANGTVLASENARLAGQLQAEYTQRIADYQSQNKNLLTQVEALNNRVASMETEMSQLIQTLTQQFQGGAVPAAGIGNMQPGAMPSSGPPPASASVASPEQAGPPPKVPYSVQAIIPGRAWLRANNGDTVTVAEGDEIKNVGKVTKIDPYDGVVEINVQGRSVSLSYGNGT